ncbi:AAA family ATPase [Prevotella sp. E13-17]|uniref:ATP-binding protein n=1 Tax=Prevotella sp. E13-17 TaxID=2913616 RepID=UPI001ED9F933|nr:AAA family ATPase [Prevotella sp. E13-17]UKK51658.1 AAA family ATPase [Prevotella sp. E13-17]
MDITLIEFMEGQLKQTTSTFHRYMFDQISWDSRMFGLVGPRGIGKSTMILQYIKEHRNSRNILYISADHLYFSSHNLVDTVDEFIKEGGEQIFIDEIHKYENWSRELKQIYDSHPDVKIGFTGSSVLDIYKGFSDLSRRAPIFMMQGLSFREYLKLFHNIDASIYTLEDVLALKAVVADVNHPLPLFRDYLKRGYYPFSSDSDFELKLRQVINQTMEVDIPQFANMTASTGRKLKKLLSVIAQSVPFKPVMDSLSTVVGVSRNILPDYFLYIEQAGMIGQLRDNTGGIRGIGKVEKVYLDNPNIAYLLGGPTTDIGNIRETFFYNQMRIVSDVISSRISDFEIDGKTFEVGGKNKGKKQITTAKEGYIVKDDIEFGSGNIIPLWAFGLMY